MTCVSLPSRVRYRYGTEAIARPHALKGESGFGLSRLLFMSHTEGIQKEAKFLRDYEYKYLGLPWPCNNWETHLLVRPAVTVVIWKVRHLVI